MSLLFHWIFMHSLLLGSILNSLLRFALMAILATELLKYGDMLNKAERTGLGLMSGSAFLTIAPIIDIYHEGTPFDGWATFVFTTGAIIYVAGRMTRHARHRLRNQKQDEIAAAYRRARGLQ